MFYFTFCKNKATSNSWLAQFSINTWNRGKQRAWLNIHTALLQFTDYQV